MNAVFRRAERWLPIAVWLVLAEIIVISVLADSAASASLDEGFSFDRPPNLALYIGAAIAILLAVPITAWWRPTRPAAAVIVALVTVAVVGAGLAARENSLNSHPTQRPAERSLADRARLDRNGDLSLFWPAFAELRQVIPGTVIIPRGMGWQPYLEEVSELPLRLDTTYNSVLDRDDPRFRGEWIFDRALREEYDIVVVGRGRDYRVYLDPTLTVLIAEDG